MLKLGKCLDGEDESDKVIPWTALASSQSKTFLMCFRVYAIKLTYHSTTEAILLSTLAVLLLQLRAVGTKGRGSGGRSPPNLTGQLNLFQSL